MFNYPKTFTKRFWQVFKLFNILWVLLAALFLIPIHPAYAHRPHDVISQLELSPQYSQDKTLFILVREQFLKSIDAGMSWQRVFNGIDNQYYFSSLVISNKNPKILFLSSLGDGIYKSQDGGKSWFKVNEGLETLNIEYIAISPYSDEIIFAAGNDILYQTSTGGKQWKPVIKAKDAITAIAFSPTNQNDIIAGDKKGNIYSTQTDNQQWKLITTLQGSGAITSLAFSPDVTSNQLLFIGTEKKGILKTVNQGISWTDINQGITDKNIEDIVILPDYQKNSTLFISTWNEGVFSSTNQGKSWQKYSRGLTKDSQADVSQFSLPHFSDLRLSNTFAQDRTLFLAGFNGLFKSTNSGKNWQELETLSTRVITALAISSNYKNDSTIAVGTYEKEAYISRDQGVTWQPMLRGLSVIKSGRGQQPPLIVEEPRFYDLMFSPNYRSDKSLFASLLYKFYRSINEGSSWQRITLPDLKNVSNRDIYLAISSNFAKDKTIYLATKYGGVIYRSTNGGKSFLAAGKIGIEVKSLAISPNFTLDRTLYAASFEGIYKTVDGGKTWTVITNSPQLKQIPWLQIAISPNYRTDRTVLAATDRGIFKTEDEGKNWQQLESSIYGKNAFITAIAISPNYQNDRTFLANVQGKGLFKTTDSGKTFTHIGQDLSEQYYPFTRMVMSASIPIQFSPTYAEDKTIYGFGSAKAEIYKSIDGGQSWQILPIAKKVDVVANFFNALKLFKLSMRIYPALKFAIAFVLSLLGYFLLNYLRLEKHLPLNVFQVKIGGTITIFIATIVLLSI